MQDSRAVRLMTWPPEKKLISLVHAFIMGDFNATVNDLDKING